EKPWGTGHALLVALEKIKEPFATINADDFYGRKSFAVVSEYLKKLNPNEISPLCMVAFLLQNTLSEHGGVSRGICQRGKDNSLQEITERHQIQNTNGRITFTENGQSFELDKNSPASMNLFGLTPAIQPFVKKMFRKFLDEHIREPKSEFYLPSIVSELIHKHSTQVKVLETPEKWVGVTYREDKAIAKQVLASLIDKNIYPSNLWKTCQQHS
ncbi:MAG: nucleotidyltransferase, partial [Cytophagales bacterium]|nr:nucleotidyltransferase [Cytophagales bacterium]